MTKVLVIDDEEGMRDMLSFSLQEEGYEVLVAENGDMGLEIAAENEIDVIITDIKMPGISGIEVLKKIKQIKPELEVIITTGFPSNDTALESRQNGAFAYVKKPFNLIDLFSLISDACKKTDNK